MQKRCENSPAGIKLVITNEVRVIALQGVKDQGLISFGDLKVGEATAVGEVKLGHDSLHGQARKLRVHLNVHGLVGLNTDDELVARNVLEDARSHVAELDTDLGLLLIEGWGL